MIDLLDPELHGRGEELAAFRALREEHGPIVRTPGRRGPGYWSVLGHPELGLVLRDPATFSSFSGTRPEVLRPEASIRPLHNLDPPAHAPLRVVAGRAIHATRLTALDPVIEAAIARVFAISTGDLIPVLEAELAHVFATWLGFRVDPQVLLARVSGVHAAGAALLETARTDPSWPARAAEAQQASRAIAELMADEIAHAREGTVLREIREAAPDQAHSLGALLVEAGLPTSSDAIGSAIVDLVDQPSALAANPDLLVEELLRRASPIAQFARLATRDVELAGVHIRAGEQVVTWMVAANHDERVFAAPEQLVPSRDPNPHVAFGAGPHRCLGAILGRRLLRAVIATLRRRTVTSTAPPVRRASSYMRGYASLPVTIESRSAGNQV